MSLGDRMRERMDEWAITPEKLAESLRWPLRKIHDLLSGKQGALGDRDRLELAFELQCTPHYLQYGLDSLRKEHFLSKKDFDWERTLYNFWSHVRIYELTLDQGWRLWEAALEAVRRRHDTVITPAKWIHYHEGLFGPLSSDSEMWDGTCPDTGQTCFCGDPGAHARGACPYRYWEE